METRCARTQHGVGFGTMWTSRYLAAASAAVGHIVASQLKARCAGRIEVDAIVMVGEVPHCLNTQSSS